MASKQISYFKKTPTERERFLKECFPDSKRPAFKYFYLWAFLIPIVTGVLGLLATILPLVESEKDMLLTIIPGVVLLLLMVGSIIAQKFLKYGWWIHEYTAFSKVSQATLDRKSAELSREKFINNDDDEDSSF
ncbi:MAG: hypothetical protein ACRC4M_04060 [Mycoplasma sp.]